MRQSGGARIDSVMSTDIVVLEAETDLRDALRVFERHPIRRLPLVAGGRIVGMLTMDDLVVNLTDDLARLSRPITAQVLFGHRETVGLATTV